MLTNSTLSDLLTTLFDSRAFGGRVADRRDIKEICRALLSETAETSGRQLATVILSRFRDLDADGKLSFFNFLNDDLDLDASEIVRMAQAYNADRSPENFCALAAASEPARGVVA